MAVGGEAFVAGLCCRAARGDGAVQTSPETRLAPQTLMAIGRANRCLPLLAPYLEPLLVSQEGLGRELAELARAVWASYELTAATLAPLFRELHTRSIAVIVYKGAAQAARYYREPWRRQMQDIDLLLDPEGMTVVGELLESAGYRLLLTPSRMRTAEVSHERTFVTDRAGVRMVDLHTFPAPPFRHPFDRPGLFARARPGQVFGAPVRFLAVEDELVVSAVNQAYDHFRGSLLRAVDGALMIGGQSVDWDAVARGAAEAQARVATWMTLRWMRDVAGAQIPVEALKLLEPAPARRAVLRVALRSDGGRPAPRFHLHRRLEQTLLTLPLMDRPATFAAYVGRHGVWRTIDAWRAFKERRSKRG